MRNRIVSLVLAIVMVVLAVPAFVLPMTAAATKELKTTFHYGTETYPVADKAAETWSYPENAAWEGGYFKIADGTYRTFTKAEVSTGFAVLNFGGADQWTNTGIYLDQARYILTGNKLDNVGPYDDEENKDPRVALSVTYNSPYEGKVDLGADVMQTVTDQTDAGATPDFYMAVLINGKMIWPTADGDMKDPTNWAHLTGEGDTLAQFNEMDRTALSGVDVTRGDKIQFVFARSKSNYCYVAPTVTFRDGYLIVPETITEDFYYGSADWPMIGNATGALSLKQTAAKWRLGDINAEGVFTEYTNYFRKGINSWAHHEGQEFANDKFNASTSNSVFVLNSGTAAERGSIRFGNKTEYETGYKFTAVATGTVTASLENILLLADDEGAAVTATSGSVVVKVYCNGTLKDQVTVTASADGVTALKSFESFDVIRGDEVVITVVRATGDASIRNAIGTPTVFYSDIESFMTENVEEKYALKMENGEAVFEDGFGIAFLTYGTTDVYNDYAGEAGLYVWDGSVAEADRTPANATVIPATLNTSFAFVAEYNDFTAKEMADALAVQAYVKIYTETGMETILSAPSTKSVAQYVTDQYEACEDEELSAALVAMLNYGAYAQTYFGYNTENLANAGLPEDLRAMDPDTLYYAKFDGQKGSVTRVCNTEVNAFTLDIDNKIDLNIYINIDADEKANNYKMQFQYSTDMDKIGSDMKLDLDPNHPVISIEDIAITDMSQVYYFRVGVRYQMTWYYGYTFSYSIESYAARMVEENDPDLANLVRAMMEFGKAVNAYNA